MHQSFGQPVPVAPRPEPTWDVAYLFPAQGQWSPDEYFALDGNRMVEFSHGHLAVLPTPTTSHQLLLAYLYGLVLAFVSRQDLGTVLFAPLRVRLWRGQFGEPDIVFLLKEHAAPIGEQFWDEADLVMEVVSEDAEDRRRDLVTRRREYARARIPEYWIVDLAQERITVLRLAGKHYLVHGEFTKGTVASSPLLPGLTILVAETLARRSIAATAKTTRKPRP